MSTRNERMSALTNRLQSSFAKKAEVEEIVAQEIASLREQLLQELETEQQRRQDIDALLAEFTLAIAEKANYIEGEQVVLEQMQALKSRIGEQSIRRQFEASMATKADLISIEVILLEDMMDCKEQLFSKELAETDRRIETMTAVVAALPSPDDREAGRRYNWDDVQRLQAVLLSRWVDQFACRFGALHWRST
ncbi:unnamed protein product [Phaeothamnion confervicola]